MEKVDCAIIGAGFAGLTCARELLKRGLSVRILEARDRIGGRVHTIRNPGQRAPIELGAEFIHGNVPEIIRPLDSHGLGYYALSDSHHFFEDGQLRLDNGFWDEVSSLSDRLDENRKTDRSVADFLAEQTASVRAKAFFRSYVEGFQAADTRKMGERGLAEEQKNEQSRSFRSVDGYGALLETYLRGDIKESLRLNTIVRKIDWKKNIVTLHCGNILGNETIKLEAKTAVVTAPLGVLKTQRIFIDPLPRGYLEKLETLQMGHTIRISFVFRHRLWEKLTNDRIGFIHAGPEFEFPTWWTQDPLNTPMIVAWQGGPRAETLALLSPSQRASRALDTFCAITKLPRMDVENELVGYFSHDWSGDPFSLGGYSYAGVGFDSKTSLDDGFENTIVFAGEAMQSDASRGTVQGAIASGDRAARKIISSSF